MNFLILKKSLAVFAAVVLSFGSWSRVTAMAESKAVKVQTAAAIIYVDGIITTLSGAIATANANPSTQYIINIQGNITMNTSALSVSNTAGVTITSDMNLSGAPFTLTKTYSGRHFTVNTGSSLSLENIVLNSSGAYGGIDVRGDLVMMNGAAIQNCSAANGGGVYGYAGSAITVAGTARITGNTATSNGGGIYGVGSAITVAGTSQITGNTTAGSGNGGGIYGNTNSKIMIAGGSISNNSAGSGGGIFVTGSSQLTVITGNITENKATGTGTTNGGGGICAGGSGSVVNVSGGVIYKNTTALNGGGILGFTGSAITVGGTAKIIENTEVGSSGGGICIVGSNTSGACSLTVGGSAEISGNAALSRGGGIAAVSSNVLYPTPHSITIEGNALIADNQAGNGGGICSSTTDSVVFINGGRIIDNRAAANGGGVYCTTGNAITFSGTAQIIGNTAGVNGGGIFIINTKLNISGGTISDNRADSMGGGICSYHDFRGASSTMNAAYVSEITVTGGSINGNKAANGGGIGNFNCFDSAGNNNTAKCIITVTDGDISGNTATENGGGIYNYAYSESGNKVSASIVTVTGGSIADNTAKGNGGGVFGYTYGISTRSSCVITVDGGDINGNSATDGGGIFGYTSSNGINDKGDCRVIVNSGNISNNTAAERGGGICGDTFSKTVVSGGKIAANGASNGGGIYALAGTIAVSGGAEIDKNNVSNNGGGIYVANQGTVSISDGSAITDNSAPNGDGGGVYTADTKYTNLTISDSTVFSGNSARAAYFFTGTPYPSIQSASVSIPGTYVLNNYDVNYTGGTRIDFFTITYNANGATGTPPSSGAYPSGATVTVAGPNTLSMNGYTFAGWNTMADSSGALYETGDTFTITHDVILYAQWAVLDMPIPPAYSVTYDANGGHGSYQDLNMAYSLEYTVLTLSDTGIANPGNIFQGWNTVPDGRGTMYQPGDVFTITGDTTLYAQWLLETAPVPATYTVTYDSNGGYGGHSDADLTLGLEYTVLPLSDTGISNPGNIFQGWNTAPNGSGTHYPTDSMFTVSGDVVLYAQWSVVNRTVNAVEGTRRPYSNTQDWLIELEEPEVPLKGEENKPKENKIPQTGDVSSHFILGISCLLISSGIAFRSKIRNLRKGK